MRRPVCLAVVSPSLTLQFDLLSSYCGTIAWRSYGRPRVLPLWRLIFCLESHVTLIETIRLQSLTGKIVCIVDTVHLMTRAIHLCMLYETDVHMAIHVASPQLHTDLSILHI